MPAHRYLVVSDLHLADVEEHADGWMAHKSARYLFDDTFADLVRNFVSRSEEGAQLTLVLNGDIVDFDLVTAVPAPRTNKPPIPPPARASVAARGAHRRALASVGGADRGLNCP